MPAKVRIEKYCYDTEQNCTATGSEMIIFPDSDGTNLGAWGKLLDIKNEIGKNKKISLILKMSYWAIDDKEKKETHNYEITIELFKDPNNPNNYLHKNVYINAD